MVYVALLRGINVGGNNKIDMKELKRTFERAGMANVVTYINTGNIIFTTTEYAKSELAPLLEQAIEDAFGLRIKVLIRSMDDYETVMNALPEGWSNDHAMKSDVLFLWEEADRESVLEQLDLKPGIDHAIYVPGAVLWSVDRENAARSGMSRIVSTKLYRQVTIRNVNTTRKIYDLMLAAAT